MAYSTNTATQKSLRPMLYSSKFRPAWWLRNPHAQTIWAAKIQPAPTPKTTRERLITPDNDFLDLDWTNNSEGPIVMIFHGLAGSAQSRYVKSLMHYLSQRGVRAVVMHFRGCSGEPNRTPRSYHSGLTTDLKFLIDTVKERHPNTALAAVGYSLGGNALLKFLATHQHNPLDFAVSVSPPLVLAEGAKRMDHGFSRIYQRRLLEQMKEALRAKHTLYPEFKLNELGFENKSNFTSFDDAVTAPLHGFASVQDYYTKASTLNDLINIKTPTHILWSRDDPFFSEACIPQDKQLAESVDFELTEHGGHVAFIGGAIPFVGKNWLRERVGSLLLRRLKRESQAP